MLLSIIPVLFSCEKEIDTEVPIPSEPEKKVWSVTIDAQKAVNETRTLTLSGNTISASWTAGDVVKVYKSGQLLGELSAISSGKTTKLSGSLEGDLSVDDELKLVYSGRNYGEQDGTLEGIAANCDAAEAYVSVIGFVGDSVKTSSAFFQSQQAITRFTFLDNNSNVLTPSLVVIRKTSAGMDYSAFSGGHGTLFQPGTIYVNNSQNQSNLYIALDGDYGVKYTYLFVVYVGNEVYTGEKKAGLYDGEYYTTNVTVTPYTPEYVDMGLSVKWAKCNLGAYYPSSGGDYYAWGEVTPKTEYTWDNYVWGTWSTDNSTISKYNLVDCKQALDLEDDAAHNRLGIGWWVPSRENWEELIDENNCTWEKDIYGSLGVRITSKITGNWIYLPAAGCIENNILFATNGEFDRYFLTNYSWDTQNEGASHYWSATRTSDDILYHCGEAMWTDKWNKLGYMAHCHRMIGMSIRPVYIEPITQVSFTASSVSLRYGDSSQQLEYTVSPETGAAREVRWESSDPSIVTVNQNGEITPVRGGTAIITVTIDGLVSASCNVTVTVPVTGVNLNKSAVSISKGSSETLYATIIPSDATNQNVTWSSNRTSVATVNSSGLVTAKAGGSAVITVRTVDGSMKATCTVTVTESGVLNGHAWVDMGNNLKWATMNVGASVETDYGDHYGWGTTWVYNNNNSYTSNPATLPYNYDAARANWGSSWRMPTMQEWDWLFNTDNCTNEWVADYKESGCSGRLFTSVINGNQVFLPAAGYWNDGTLYGEGSYGRYWSSSITTTSLITLAPVWYYYVNSNEVSRSNQGNRRYGLSVRPVAGY